MFKSKSGRKKDVYACKCIHVVALWPEENKNEIDVKLMLKGESGNDGEVHKI